MFGNFQGGLAHHSGAGGAPLATLSGRLSPKYTPKKIFTRGGQREYLFGTVLELFLEPLGHFFGLFG